jgi:tRNA A-37 threonylcarbamoyl transferase component Bud32
MPDDWQRIETLFLTAADLAPAARSAFLADACSGEPGLRAEVEDLLRADTAGDVISGTIVAVAAELAGDLGASRAGERVGAYRLERELGHGGMGTVYLAERADDAYRARVAIKFVRGSLAAPELERRFRAERQILATLNHPNIARLLDGGTTADGTPYLVMEYVDGVPIDEWCDTRALGVGDRVELFLRVCDGVDCAHRARVIHRDLKPSNILVAPDGTPKLVDFGIAKLLFPGSGAEATATIPILTPAYASPEQVRGRRTTVATDIYSLGAVLYRLLAGRPPLDVSGVSAGELELRICREEPPAPSDAAVGRDAAWRGELMGALDDVVLRALRKEPERRPESVHALGASLRAALAAPPSRRRAGAVRHRLRRLARHPAAWVAAGALVLAAGVTSVAARRAAAHRIPALGGWEFLPVQQAAAPIPTPYVVHPADVNGDGIGDLVWNHLASGSNQTYVGLGRPDGRFAPQPPFTHPAVAPEGWRDRYRMFVGDFDGDGRDDLLWNRLGDGKPNRVYAALSRGDGTYTFLPEQAVGPSGWSAEWNLLVGDHNGDGADDLVFSYLRDRNLSRIYRSDGRGGFSEYAYTVHPAENWTGYRAFLSDVDGDGVADLFWNDVPVWANRTYVALSRPTGADLLAPQNHEVATGWADFTTFQGDFNGDGLADLAWIATGRDVVPVYSALGQAMGTFRYLPVQHVGRPAGGGTFATLVADVNGDRRADLLWNDLDSTANRLSVGLGRAPGGFAFSSTAYRHPASGVDWRAFREGIVVLDANGDGRLDVVWNGREGTNRIYVALAGAPGS